MVSMKIKISCLIALFTLCALAPAWSSGGRESGPETPGAQHGRIAYREGVVTVNGEPVDFGAIVNSSDVVETGEASYCEILLGSHNVIRLEAETVMVFNLAEGVLDLEQGGLAAVFGKLSEFFGGDELQVRTPAVAAGIRGTVFYVRDEGGSTYFCLCNGKLRLKGAGEPLTAETTHHYAYRFDGETRRLVPESPGLLYHDDAFMESVAERVNYQIPWGP